MKIATKGFCAFQFDLISRLSTIANESVCRTRKSVKPRRSVRPRKYLSGSYSSLLFATRWNICDKEVTRSYATCHERWKETTRSHHLLDLFATYFKASPWKIWPPTLRQLVTFSLCKWNSRDSFVRKRSWLRRSNNTSKRTTQISLECWYVPKTERQKTIYVVPHVCTVVINYFWNLIFFHNSIPTDTRSTIRYYNKKIELY